MQRPSRSQRALVSVAILKPVLRAYLFGHASTTGPLLLNFILSVRRKRLSTQAALAKLYNILLSSLDYNKFPAFCATLVGAYTLLQDPLWLLLKDLARRQGTTFSRNASSIGTSRFLAAFISSWISLGLLNSSHGSKKGDSSSSFMNTPDIEQSGTSTPQRLITQKLLFPGHRPPLIGKTLDLTLLASVRALDAIVGHLWVHDVKPMANGTRCAPISTFISKYTDATVFATSAGIVMWAWFYLPERLPRAYNEWISSAAQVDSRLVLALRKARWGEFIYGKDTGQSPLLEGMCKEYNWPLAWADPSKTIPIPCEMVHMGCGPSCHKHAVSRFVRAFKFSFTMYLPLQLLLRFRNPSVKALKAAVTGAIRSSAFLSTFISLFYYSVCLSRTLLGPKLFSKEKVTPQMWDSGLCVRAACIMCGWSILVEAEKRRQEIAFFVAPRAAATILPRRYEKQVCCADFLWGQLTNLA
jgi:hypothetical protein